MFNLWGDFGGLGAEPFRGLGFKSMASYKASYLLLGYHGQLKVNFLDKIRDYTTAKKFKGYLLYY